MQVSNGARALALGLSVLSIPACVLEGDGNGAMTMAASDPGVRMVHLALEESNGGYSVAVGPFRTRLPEQSEDWMAEFAEMLRFLPHEVIEDEEGFVVVVPGTELVPLCLRERNVEVPFYLLSTYEGQGATLGECGGDHDPDEDPEVNN